MNTLSSRRTFLADVGRGMLIASVGSSLASDLGLAKASTLEALPALSFGPLEPLVSLMQETPVDKFLPRMVEQIRSGTSLSRLISAGALANARTFGGEDYIGFHTMMALAPALHMSRELPPDAQPLPVLKVLYRNTSRIQAFGGRAKEVLHPVEAASLPAGRDPGEILRAQIRAKDTRSAEQSLARLANHSAEDAFNALLFAIQDNGEVHRVVMPYRAWDLLGIVGKEHAQTLLRQSIHYCVRSESGQRGTAWDAPRTLLPKLLEEHKLLGAKPGDRHAEDSWIEQLSQTIFNSSPEQAAGVVASALAEGFSIKQVGEAISLAANQLVLRDHGRTPRDEVIGKPPGSVHGDSIGVHACDSANAWRNMALVSNARNSFACLIVGAYQTAFDRINRGGDFLNWEPLPIQRHLNEISVTDAPSLLREAEEAIKA